MWIVRLIGILVIIAVIALAPYLMFVRPWHLRWGATDAEIHQSLPGDELVHEPKLESTRAITVDAPASEVWPWLVQMGQRRAGFYSYDWLLNLLGCDMLSADRIDSDWQNLQAGDSVWLHPKLPPLRVTVLEPGRALVLGRSWAFILQETGQVRTRLIIRTRRVYDPDFGWLGNFVIWRVVCEPLHFIIERKMLLGIKCRAEQTREEIVTGSGGTAAGVVAQDWQNDRNDFKPDSEFIKPGRRPHAATHSL
jgi:hypothetical protein